MAVTAGTSWQSPIDLGISEALSSILGTQIGAYNPAQHSQAENGALSGGSPEQLVSQNGGSTQSTPFGQAYIPSTDVLGTSDKKITTTTNTPNNNTKNNGGGGKYTASDALKAGLDINTLRALGMLNEDASSGQSAMLDAINSAYDEGLGVLNTQEQNLNAMYPEDIKNLESKVAGQKSAATTEGNQLTTDVEQQQTLQNQKITSALEDAIRSYNAMRQQNMARFGLGSSTGGAVGELAAQEYYRQQGGINQEGINVNQQFATEFGKIKTYTQKKMDDLDQYKNEAVSALKKDLQDRLNTIAVAKADIGTNKANARLQAIQSTIASAREIANQATQFRQQLATTALNNMQTVAGRAFTPAEIKAVLDSYGVTLSSNTTGTTASTTTPYTVKSYKYDDLGNLISA